MDPLNQLDLSDGLLTVTVQEGQVFRVPLIETVRLFRAFAKKCSDEGKDHYSFLDMVIAHIRELTTIQLNLAQADELSDLVEAINAKKKQERLSAMQSMLTLPSSTESTPSD